MKAFFSKQNALLLAIRSRTNRWGLVSFRELVSTTIEMLFDKIDYLW